MVIAQETSRLELLRPKKHLTVKYPSWQASSLTQEKIDQELYLKHCIVWPRNLDTINTGSKVFTHHQMWCWRRIDIEKMVRESN